MSCEKSNRGNIIKIQMGLDTFLNQRGPRRQSYEVHQLPC